jgi:apyrase
MLHIMTATRNEKTMFKSLIKLAVPCFLLAFSMMAIAHDNIRYSVVIDAGSSGSRLHIFAKTQVAPGQLPTITDLSPSDNTVHPGIASYAEHPNDAGPALQPLLDKAQQVFSNAGVRYLSEVEFNLMATAGMRLLPTEKQAQIYHAVSNYLSTHSKYHVKTMATIPGKMEGIYGWLAVNYLENNFRQDKQSTAGSLDLGGASTQIVYASSHIPKKADGYSFRLAGKQYHIFSHSFLGLGQDQARKSIASLACYPTGYSVPGLGMGQFNYLSCRVAVDKLLITQGIKRTLPPIASSMKYVAYSGFYYTASFFQAKDLAELDGAVQQVCSLNWDELQRHYPKTPAKYLASYCFNGIYSHQLLTFGYRFPKNTQQINFKHQIASKEIDWATGVVVANAVTP